MEFTWRKSAIDRDLYVFCANVSDNITVAVGNPNAKFARRAREVASRRFIGSPECQALVQAAFQRSAEAKLAGKADSLDIEKQLLAALADVKSEFGLPDR